MDLTLKIGADTAELKKGLSSANNQLTSFKNGLVNAGKLIGVAFSAKLVLDFGKKVVGMLTDISTNVEELKGKISKELYDEISKANERLATANEKLKSTFGQLFGGASAGLTNMKASFIELTQKYLVIAINKIIQLTNYFIDIYNNSMLFRYSVETTVFWFKQLFNVVSLVGKNIIDVFGSAGELIKAVFTGNFQDIPRIYKEAITKVLINTKEFGQQLAEDFKTGVNNVLNAKPIKLIDEIVIQDAVEEIKKPFTALQLEVKKLNDLNIKLPAIDVKNILDARLAQEQYNWQVLQAQLNAEKLAANEAMLKDVMIANSDQQKLSGNVFEQVHQAMMQSATKVIKAHIAEGIAGAVAKTLASLPFPANVILAGAAGIAANSLLNALIPSFATGGLHSGGWALVGERGPELINTSSPARVYNHQDTAKMFNSLGSTTQHIVVTGSIANDVIYLANKEAQRRRGV